MAPIELRDLSSNWKKLQQTLETTKSTSKPPPSKSAEKKEHTSLKRKRAGQSNGETKQSSSSVLLNRSTRHPSQKLPLSRKRQKMEEPPSIGSSTKHVSSKTLRTSASVPSLRHPSLLTDPQSAIASVSILAASPHHPDIENEGVSTSALPGKYIALDCEMVGCGPEPDRDSALARVSVVNYHGHQIYDSYVRVKVPVTDYRTAISGIEPKHLRPDVARPFKEVQDDIRILLQGRILVGHAVKNDLSALILSHPKPHIRDTSKFKAVGVEIQVGRHSSVEDARATMALYRLEKTDFEDDIRKRYGHIKVGDAEEQALEIVDGVVAKQKRKNRKKKKKKKA
ncbi:ribonuclease H-like domain-containing protein [Clohesyomyces aquaticus]|uniref:RNA exonuclease 4 n=1 Tax=Clohesyomyces aquaticus TaxID=1231657 RepID=A0A1Y1YCI4_9PLEO|nr:ribonuclease H-like domain-containing protein [Clohesyomyces aquaticus]